ncbi:MAG: mechanosensitive ion channel family protein [Alphaproteobacteria bacterium]|nr:mechanosensitive ion channel family protein [Alphaproteobacteria bacterium]
MYPYKPIAHAIVRVLAICFAVAILVIGLPTGALSATPKAGNSAVSPKSEATPEKIQELMALLADPKVRDWLEQESKAEATQARESDAETNSISHEFDSHVAAVREHIVALGLTLPDLPNQFEHAAALVGADLGNRGRLKVLLHVALFVALGFGVEWLFRKATERVRRHLDEHPLETVSDRLRVVATRFAFAVGVVAAFALGSIGPFLTLDWAPLFREMVLGYLLVFLMIRVAIVVGHFLLSPHHEHFRIIPVDTVAARFWCRRIAAFVGLFAFGWVEFGLLDRLGLSLESRQLVAYVLGLGLLAIALETVWRRPVAPEDAVEPASPAKRHHLGRSAENALLSIGIVLLWVLWVLHAMASFWLVLVVISLPLALGVTCRAVQHLLRPAGSAQVSEGPPSVIAVCLERGIRALLFIGAAAALAWGWGIDLIHLAAGDDILTRIAHGVLSAIIILLVADVLWHAMKTAIDRKLAESADLGQPSTDEARRNARLRTLLPIFRNILFVVVIAVAVLMALSAMGVPITPLVAGAGVLGIAVGFGAQTFARDIIAGMFYLIDDAFRVGEYIQSGNYKGTVEGFSIRSVRLRHQRGAVYTVPFSLLGAVQNQSRDWTIDKLMVGITYDSNIELAKKLIKQIGLELAEDPEFKPLILEPLKMQGVDALGDFAVQLRMKMMTLPGENFPIRRQALAMIKKAFDANGIKFAFPTVQVAGEGEPSTAAVAQRALQLTQPAAAE